MVNAVRCLTAAVAALAIGIWMQSMSVRLATVDDRLKERNACTEAVFREHDDALERRLARAIAERDAAEAKLKANEEEAAKQ